jgi:hypothetical protein
LANALAVQWSKNMNDLTLTYKGKTFVVLDEAEIVNNTCDGLLKTGFVMDRFGEAMRDLGVFADVYHPDKVE